MGEKVWLGWSGALCRKRVNHRSSLTQIARVQPGVRRVPRRDRKCRRGCGGQTTCLTSATTSWRQLRRQPAAWRVRALPSPITNTAGALQVCRAKVSVIVATVVHTLRTSGRDAFSTAMTGVSARRPPASRLACNEAARDTYVHDQRQRAPRQRFHIESRGLRRRAR